MIPLWRGHYTSLWFLWGEATSKDNDPFLERPLHKRSRFLCVEATTQDYDTFVEMPPQRIMIYFWRGHYIWRRFLFWEEKSQDDDSFLHRVMISLWQGQITGWWFLCGEPIHKMTSPLWRGHLTERWFLCGKATSITYWFPCGDAWEPISQSIDSNISTRANVQKFVYQSSCSLWPHNWAELVYYCLALL